MAKIELSSKDKEMLFELSLNARMTITELARKVKLSKQVVSYRLNLLEKNKVILGYYAITNVYMLGKTHYRVFIKYQNMSSEKEQEFMSYLINHPKVVWIADYGGDWDAAYLVWADNVREFETVFDEINEKYGIYFQQKYFSIATRLEYLKYKFLTTKKDTSSLVFGETSSNYKLDQLDKNILNDLNRNGRMTLVELANKYNSSAKVIRERIKKMEKNKIILGYNIKLNQNLLGLTHYKILLRLNDTSRLTIRRLSNYLKDQRDVIYLVKPIGDYDFEFELMTKSNEEFHQIIRDLRSQFAEEIKSYNTAIHYQEPKSGQSYNF